MADLTALIDYGAGNLHSVHNALNAVGANVVVTDDPVTVAKADRIVLPGVGAYRTCANGLRGIDGMVEAMEQRVLAEGAPFLGICVGMQLLATRGLEHGETPGLNWIPGDVVAIERTDPLLRVPHMGWNEVEATTDHPLLPRGGVGAGHAYFVHSYCFDPADPSVVAATCTYGEAFPALIARGNVAGTQFHPEKSQGYGIALLSRFLEWCP